MLQEENENQEKNAKNTKKTVFIVLGVIVITILVLMLINVTKNKKPTRNMAGSRRNFGAGNTSLVTSVATVVAQKETMHDFVVTNGDVQTQSSIDVFPSIGGKIVQVNVSLGSQVAMGDVIAYVDPSAAGVNYKRSPVTAPISGSIITSPVKTGQQVSTASVVTKIGDIDNLQITASVPERYVGYLQNGLKAEITLEAYPDVNFIATVVRVSPVLDATSRTKEVILHFDQKDPRINAGMFAKVKLYTVDYPDTIAISQDALVTQNDENYLFVVKEDDTVEKRLVTLGKNVNGYYQILSGIDEGDKVVTAGMLTLAEGSKVLDISNNK